MSKIGITKTFDLGDGRMVTLETGKLAKQANGSVVVKIGNTMLLATVVANKDAKEGVDFLPLSVDYQEKFAAAGKFPGGFFKREARLSENEILTSRLVDRALRPLFPDDFHADVQVMISLISADKNIQPDAYACLAAATAIALSDIPFNGPISEVRVGRVDGKFVINPDFSQMANSDLDMMVAASEKDITMVEGEMKEISEQDMVAAIKFAHEAIRNQIRNIVEFAKQANAPVTKREYNHETNDAELKEKVYKDTYEKAYAVAKTGNADKHARSEAFGKVLSDYLATYSDEERTSKTGLIKKYYHDVEYHAVRNLILDEKKRLDGRGTADIRPIWSEVDYLPCAHGSAIFTRGETQSLTSVTLGTKLDQLKIDGAVISGEQRFYLHYNFPAFSTGEARPNRGVGRREVGHGNLALRALKQVFPTDCPYTVRVVSDILESNGSSSMATVCAGTLALMDAGVNIAKPVTGIAMGLITAKGKFAVLSDILGDEDHLGDMDFKVCGTKDGITACQMDLKVDGLPYEVMVQALEQAKAGRLHILNEITKTLDKPRTDYKPHAPRLVQITVPKEFIGAIIGPGGKIIQEMQRETGTTIVIEEKNEMGYVDIAGDNQEAVEAALKRIRNIVAVPEVGEIYEGKVKSILNFGAFIEFMPGKDGLLHISEVEHRRLDNLEGIIKEGDIVKVKLIGVDPKTGKFKLSRKVLLPNPKGEKQEEQA
ncbi:MAG: polyribonucleotide nucleotidyltransferase [Bacteroidia bacterium]